ncbi:hypothetical protein R1flu_018261 [Riccia fluitans]|uniref:Bulb-type lectin domain-containing protein n=1 Tax=Riccia fluitans TaxID=41844 RepID=A0ABD1ZFI3_9MARC
MARSSIFMLLLVAAVLQISVGVGAQGTNTFNWDFQMRGDAICTNLATGVTIDNHPPYAMNTAGFSDSHRNIISYDTDDIYALGFEKLSSDPSASFALSIYKWFPSDSSARPSVFQPKGLSGIATVDEGATFRILRTGSLELRASDGSLAWTTGTESAGATRMEFDLDEGNLILYNNSGAKVWESRLNNGSR